MGLPDRDGDGYPDICDPNPDACASTADDVVGTATDSDGDGIADEAPDNCKLVSNRDQRDGDLDGVGDACDKCPGRPDAEQRDADGDGVGDACDPCAGDPTITVPPADGTLPTCGTEFVNWRDLAYRQRRSRLQVFARPSMLFLVPSHEEDDFEAGAGLELAVVGSVDAWQLDQARGLATPPSVFYHAGLYADLSTFTDNDERFGPVLGIDWRPLSVSRSFKFGLQVHHFVGRTNPEADDENWAQRLGASVKVGFLDIVSLAPAVQLDLASDMRLSFGAIVLFDVKYLEDLGVLDPLQVGH